MSERCDVLVIGGGAAGSAAAYHLARRGRRVCLLERFGPGHRRGSSHGSSRILRVVYPDPLYVEMAVEAAGLWRDLEADSGASLVTTVGGVDAGDAGRLERSAAVLSQVGVPFEVVAGADARRRWPHLRLPGDVLVQPDAARVDADAAVRTLQGRASALGAQVHHRVAVTALDVGDDEVVARSPVGDWAAPVAVVAVGAWTSTLVGRLVRLPALEVSQEQVLHLQPRDPARPWPAFIVDEPDGRLLYGLPTAGEGVKVAEHRCGRAVGADTRDGVVDPAGRARVLDFARRCLPGLELRPQAETTCLYTSTVSEDFVLDRVGPLVVGTACSGHGFKFTPLVGRMLADLAMGGRAHPRFVLPASAPARGAASAPAGAA